MKRMMCILLTLCLLAALTACGEGEKTVVATDSVMEATTPITEPTTEATLSPEEQLLSSLPESTRQAYEVGLVALEQLEDLERAITIGEAAEMLQKAYVHRTGVESKTLNELAQTPEYASITATRGLIAALPGLADIELVDGEYYENYEQWLQYIAGYRQKSAKGSGGCVKYLLSWTYWQRLQLNMTCLSSLFEEQGDIKDALAAMGEELLYTGISEIHMYAQAIYDDTNGKKFMTIDADGNFNPFREMTLQEVMECALVYYHYPNPIAIPEFVAPEDVGAYNSDIITADLLSRETDLPEASCQHLPAEWHGVILNDWNWLDEDCGGTDGEIYEYEIQAVKDAGFNFIGLELDLDWLQDYWLFKSDEPYCDFVNAEDKGSFSVERLEKLDQVLAWCMERDIHLNIRVTYPGNNYNGHGARMAILPQGKLGQSFPQYWQALARRYTDIPNQYLSFTVFTNASVAANKTGILNAIDAIQEVSPERCIIADCYNHIQSTSAYSIEAFAQRGVALSYTLQMTDTTVLTHRDLYRYNMKRECNELVAENFVQEFTWPYGELDGETVLSKDRWGAESFYDIMGMAELYGVGFMLSDFSISSIGVAEYPNYRYPDEAYHAMIADITSAVESRGYGWCFGHMYGYFGIADCIPRITDSTYEQVEDYPYYIDQTMLSWFRQLNHVS